MKTIKLRCSFFEHLYLIKGKEEDIVKYCNDESTSDYKPTNAEGKTFGFFEKDIYSIYIWIKEGMKNDRTIKATYHEAGHALIDIFDEMNIKIGYDNDEIFLYSQEDIVNQILKHLNATNTKKTKRRNV